MNFIPENLIQEFVKVSGKNYSSQDGKHIETLAFLVGYSDEFNNTKATHLIFPRQKGDASKVDDQGK